MVGATIEERLADSSFGIHDSESSESPKMRVFVFRRRLKRDEGDKVGHNILCLYVPDEQVVLFRGDFSKRCGSYREIVYGLTTYPVSVIEAACLDSGEIPPTDGRTALCPNGEVSFSDFREFDYDAAGLLVLIHGAEMGLDISGSLEEIFDYAFTKCARRDLNPRPELGKLRY